MVENAAAVGNYFIERLSKIKNDYIKEVRGRGLMIGVELLPEAGGARAVCEKLMEKGVLSKECHQNVLRLTPPLVIKREEVDWVVERIVDVLTNL
jgi:ornithine--oxo-acid transaminase